MNCQTCKKENCTCDADYEQNVDIKFYEDMRERQRMDEHFAPSEGFDNFGGSSWW